MIQCFFSSAWLCQQSCCRGAAVRRPSFNSDFSETAAWIQAKFCGEVPISAISPDLFFFLFFFQNVWFSFFLTIFFFVFVNMGHSGSPKFQNVTFPTISIRFHRNFMTNMIVMGEYRQLLLEFLLTYGAGNFKTLHLQFSSDVSQTLWGHWLPWYNTGYYFCWQSAKF